MCYVICYQVIICPLQGKNGKTKPTDSMEPVSQYKTKIYKNKWTNKGDYKIIFHSNGF